MSVKLRSMSHPSKHSLKRGQRVTQWTVAHAWSRLSPYPGGRWLFSKMIGRLAPYTGSIPAYVSVLESGRSVVLMKDRRRIRNHLKSIHAIALINLGELVTGLCVMYGVDGCGRGIVKERACKISGERNDSSSQNATAGESVR